MKKSLCILSICFAAFACCSACKQLNNPENPADPKTEIKHALQDACLPVYFEEIIAEANGKALIQQLAGWAVITSWCYDVKGGEQEDMRQALKAIIAFNKCQENVPDALYLGGENGEETVKVEKIEMVTPELAVCEMPDHFHIALVEPIPLATENVDGAPADSYLVDLKTINVDVSVRRAEDVENNLEKFAEKTFMRMLCIERSVQLRSIDKVYQRESDGPEDPKFAIEPLVGWVGSFLLARSIDR